MNFNSIYPVCVREKVMSRKGVEVENIYQTKYGSLKAMDLVGVRYGTKVQLSKGYGFALHPTLELWTPSQVLSPISLWMLCMNKLKYFLSTLKYFSGPRFYTARTSRWWACSWSCGQAAWWWRAARTRACCRTRWPAPGAARTPAHL